MKRIKKILASLMVVVMVLTSAPLSGFVGMELNLDWFDFNTKASAASYSGTCGDNLIWSLDTETGELVISGTGEMTAYSSTSAVPWHIYRSSIKTVTIHDGITSIVNYAFYYCTSLTNITIPDSVTSIDSYAFAGCDNLTSITIPDSVIDIDSYAFAGCGLTSVKFPDSVTSIGDYAFCECYNLTSVIIGNSVTKIGDYAFAWCYNLTNVKISDSVTSIGDDAFEGCTSLTSITIPDSVTSIGDSAFANCSRLVLNLKEGSYAETYAINNNLLFYCIYDENEEKIISVTVTSKLSFEINKETYTMTVNCIGNMISFTNEDAPWIHHKGYIKHIIINDGCTSISDNSFKNLRGVKSVTISDSVTSIGSSAFYGCTSLISVTIPNSVTSIGDYAFCECNILTSVTIPDSVITIGGYAFCYCDSLVSVTIGNGVTTIGSDAFYYCDNLVSVTIGNGVTTIGSDAFSQCHSLTSVIIPDSVTSIGKGAFYNCSGITELTMPISANISNYPYTYCTNIEKITLTKGNGTAQNYTASTYSNTPWYISREKCTEIIIEDGVTAIGSYMFYECSNIGNVTLPISVQSIGNNAFSGCQKLEKLTVNNPNCTFGTECTSYYTTICGYAGSTAEAYANEMGFDFELIVPCEHNNYHIERKDSTCIETGYEKLICDDCGSTFSYTEIPRVDHDYKTITAPPTCVDEGAVVCLCKVCRDAYISEILDPLGHSELVWVTVKVPSTRNEGIMNQVCPACGEVFDTKTVPAISLSADSTANIDFETNTISGFDSGSSSISDYLFATNNGYTFTCESEKIATGTVITLTAGEDTINEFEAVIFGDTNGDGWYDGQDAIIVDCLANGMLTKDDVSEAVYTAADCNHDGVIDQLDVALLNEAGTLLTNVDQSKPAEVLLETSAEYVEYLDLIDQSPEIVVEGDMTTEDEDISTDDEEPTTLFDTRFFTFIFDLISIIKSTINFISGFVNT